MPPPGGFEFPWVLGKVTVGGVEFTNVGVRFKGNSSFNGSRGSLKRPFKLDFDRHVPGRTLAGLEELFLNNNANDPSQLRESLAYSAFAKAGVPAPRTTGLRVWLRRGDSEPRQYLGLYTGAEPVEGDFLKRHFGSKRGLLTKPERVRGLEYLGDRWSAYTSRYETRSTVRTADARRFMRLLRDLNESTDPTFIEIMKREVDLDGLLRFVAVNAWLANYDSFLGNGHNYYLFMPSEGPLHFIAWDLNEAFGRHPMAGSAHEQASFSILHPAVAPNAFLERFLNQPEWRDRYQTLVRSLGDGSELARPKACWPIWPSYERRARRRWPRNLAEASAEGRAEAPGARSFLRATVPDDLMISTWNRARPRGPQFARTHSQGNPRNVVRDRGSTTPRWRTGFWSGIDRCKPNSMAIGQRPHPGCV